MLYSTQTDGAVATYGLYEGVKLLIDAGYPALDMTLYGKHMNYATSPEWEETAKKLLDIAGERGVVFNQAHAPFGGGYKHYTENLVPHMPRVFAFCGLLGIKTVVVHPLQEGRYYGHEKELFARNVEFYKGLAPYAKDAGIKIGIENMWQIHPQAGYIVDDACAPPEELAEMYDTLNDPEAFTICLDIGHVALCGREPEDAIRTIGPDRLDALHIHDVDYRQDMHTLPGMGRINWNNVLDALADIKYKGDLTLEADSFLHRYDPEFKPVAMKFMADCIGHMANKLTTLMKAE